jgi:hypothetical protein
MAGIARENMTRVLNDWQRHKLLSRLSGYYCPEDTTHATIKAQLDALDLAYIAVHGTSASSTNCCRECNNVRPLKIIGSHFFPLGGGTSQFGGGWLDLYPGVGTDGL